MPDYFGIPLQVFGWGFVISLLIAFMIKILHKIIQSLFKDDVKEVK